MRQWNTLAVAALVLVWAVIIGLVFWACRPRLTVSLVPPLHNVLPARPSVQCLDNERGVIQANPVGCISDPLDLPPWDAWKKAGCENGMDPTGKLDSTCALSAAIAAVGGDGALYVPNGTYKIGQIPK